MKKHEKSIIPVLLGGDLNAYSVALAAREACEAVSHAFVRYKCGATENSGFIKTHIVSGIDNINVAVPELLKFAAEHTCAELFLIPCADWYVELLQNVRGALSGLYHINIPDKYLWRRLSDKCGFYSLVEEHGITYPEYVAFSPGEEIAESKLHAISYPAVLKPSDSTEYWRIPFPDMHKVYFPKNAGEAHGLINRIFESGYKGMVILQKKVGNKDSNRVLTTYSDSRGRVVRAVYGDVILEELGKTSYGNHSAIITLPLDKICFELIDFLNAIAYTGIANFDILTDGSHKYVLEINTRQGRSCDYLRCAGVNIFELLMKDAFSESIAPDFSYREIYWHYPPHKTVMRYADTQAAQAADRLYKSGKSRTPYTNGYEGIVRRTYVAIHNMRLASTIKRNYPG